MKRAYLIHPTLLGALLLFHFSWRCPFAHAEEVPVPQKHMEMRVSDDRFIQGIKYGSLVITTLGLGKATQAYIIIRGQYLRPTWKLSVEMKDKRKDVPVAKNHKFLIQVPVSKAETDTVSLRLIATGPKGQTESESLLLSLETLELVSFPTAPLINDYYIKLTPFLQTDFIDAFDLQNTSSASFRSRISPGIGLSLRAFPRRAISYYLGGSLRKLTLTDSSAVFFDSSAETLWRVNGGATFRFSTSSIYSFSVGGGYRKDFLVLGKDTSTLTMLPVNVWEIEFGNSIELLNGISYSFNSVLGLRLQFSRLLNEVSFRNGFELEGGFSLVKHFNMKKALPSQAELTPYVSWQQSRSSLVNQTTLHLGLRFGIGW